MGGRVSSSAILKRETSEATIIIQISQGARQFQGIACMGTIEKKRLRVTKRNKHSWGGTVERTKWGGRVEQGDNKPRSGEYLPQRGERPRGVKGERFGGSDFLVTLSLRKRGEGIGSSVTRNKKTEKAYWEEGGLPRICRIKKLFPQSQRRLEMSTLNLRSEGAGLSSKIWGKENTN